MVDDYWHGAIMYKADALERTTALTDDTVDADGDGDDDDDKLMRMVM